MNRPYIICHMVTSIDGKVTGDFLGEEICSGACDIYYNINRELESNGFICGRVTMEGSFTKGWYPDLSIYESVPMKRDHVVDNLSGRYAIAFDSKGKLGWQSSKIVDPDGDPGYDGAQIVEVLTEQVDERYLGYLESMGISYLFAGKTEIDVPLALAKLKTLFGCETLLLEGGSILNGAFQRADVIDELSLVLAPTIGDKEGKPLYMDSDRASYRLVSSQTINGNLMLNYKRNR